MKKGVLPDELLEEIKSFNCVLFAGAGTTTEQYDKSTFLEQIKEKCKYRKKIKNQSFPDVMQYYCQKLDNGRKTNS